MDFHELSQNLAGLKGDYFLIKCPEMDFTDTEKPAYIDIFSGDKELRLDLTVKDLPRIISFLRRSVFNKDYKPGRVICWQIKNLFSYLHHFTGQECFLVDELSSEIKTPLILDLKILERYCGIIQAPPESYIEAVRRLRKLDLTALKRIYNKLHLPLMKEVIPAMENTPLVSDTEEVYSYYDIEGQVNGRLKATPIFKNSYNPHGMGEKEKEILKAPFYEQVFIYLDFSAWEVRIGQWLSQDKALGSLFNEKDIYFAIFETITGKKETDPQCREFTKNLILPVMFGAGVKRISESLNLKEKNAEIYIDRLYRAFPDLFNFLQSQTTLVQEGFATDYFGRKRFFEQKQEYLAMNFCIQSPAATICQLKLVDLHRELKLKNLGKLAFSVHDGYGILCDRQEFRQTVGVATEILESESEVYPGLQLRATASAGIKLSKMKELKRRG